MDVTRLAVLLISLAIFALALYEAFTIVSIIGKMPRFWIFFIAAIAVVIGNRVLQILTPGVAASEIDSDVVPILFSALLFVWVYDMKRSFQRAAPKAKAQTQLIAAPEQA